MRSRRLRSVMLLIAMSMSAAVAVAANWYIKPNGVNLLGGSYSIGSGSSCPTSTSLQPGGSGCVSNDTDDPVKIVACPDQGQNCFDVVDQNGNPIYLQPGQEAELTNTRTDVVHIFLTPI